MQGCPACGQDLNSVSRACPSKHVTQTTRLRNRNRVHVWIQIQRLKTHTTIKDEDVVEIQLSEDAVPASKMLSEIYRNPGSVDVLPER